VYGLGCVRSGSTKGRVQFAKKTLTDSLEIDLSFELFKDMGCLTNLINIDCHTFQLIVSSRLEHSTIHIAPIISNVDIGFLDMSHPMTCV